MGKPIASSAQTDMIERSRRESFLDRAAPLGYPPPTRIEAGVSAQSYYRAKMARGEYGRFWFHHVQHFPRESR
jgi:hypothetical protein